MINFFNHTKEDVEIFNRLHDEMKRHDSLDIINEIEDMFFDLSSQLINDKHGWFLLVTYYEPLGMWEKVLG